MAAGQQPENLHRCRRQHEEGEEEQKRTMDVCDAVPLLRIASGTRETNGHEQRRHDERCEHDDVKVGDEINCSATNRERNIVNKVFTVERGILV